MAVQDARGAGPSAKVGGPEQKRVEIREVWMLNKEGKKEKALRQNVNDLINFHQYTYLGPVEKVAPSFAEIETVAVESGPVVDAGAKAPEAPNELEVLRARATELGLSFHPATGKKKLAEAIEIAEAELAGASE
jgi:hypothetical protein